jgi:hypothetical protein
VFAALWGAGDAIIQTQINGNHGNAYYNTYRANAIILYLLEYKYNLQSR